MVDTHPNLGTEIQRLAQTALAMLTPLVQAGAGLLPPADADLGKCQQLWCPACAMAAVASGEQHPLVTLLAEHGAAILSMLRAMIEPDDPQPARSGPTADGATQPSPATSGYQPIPVTIHD